ncbi:MAG: GMC family oxidoreductase [Pseudomonadota bacterium]
MVLTGISNFPDFGKPRLNLKWELHDQDLKTIQGLAEEVGKAFAEQDVARFQMAPDISTGKSALGMHCHHMGTTRMSADPRFGVVDRDCKLHGVDNLYLGGSSVFPTGGGANPTLTIVTLALRLSEHLNVKLNSV